MRIAKLSLPILILFTITFIFIKDKYVTADKYFNPARAMQDVAYQVGLGPRVVGSEAHQSTIQYIKGEMEKSGWIVVTQDILTSEGYEIHNIIAKKGKGSEWIVMGAHYDSRLKADKDPDQQKQNEAVPGANDGASGVAVLLELGRTLPKPVDKEYWFVFFDAEDNGGIDKYEWIMGSQAFVSSLTKYPDSVVIIDMVGDNDLTIYRERNSDPILTDEIWQTAKEMKKDQFINTEKYSIMDDHTPFLNAGIPAIDIIDFDYPYWHTTSDTVDKVSGDSLAAVGDTLYAWLVK